jgi:Ca2+-binding RTX toxin-like protein
LFVGTAFPIVETAALRDTFYSSVQEIKGKLGTGSLLVESLVGKTSGALITQAKTNIAARYALVHLNPFIITGNDALYAQHNTKGELDLVNPTTGQGLSEQYLKDRAKFLALKNELAVADRPWQEAIPSDMHGYYEDRGSQFSINNTYNSTRVPAAEYIFGTDNTDVIESFRDPRVPDISFNDHMFGSGGNDIIRTHAGNDYLEGGSGQDSMDGGAGDDTFFVQGTDTDYDVFRGGPDTDTILGSKGTTPFACTGSRARTRWRPSTEGTGLTSSRARMERTSLT